MLGVLNGIFCFQLRIRETVISGLLYGVYVKQLLSATPAHDNESYQNADAMIIRENILYCSLYYYDHELCKVYIYHAKQHRNDRSTAASVILDGMLLVLYIFRNSNVHVVLMSTSFKFE